MAELENPENLIVVNNRNKEEEEVEQQQRLLNFDTLCSRVALQTQGKWKKLESGGEYCSEIGNAHFDGVLRMWEGEVVLDFFDDHRVALESACCPWYRFGKNMKSVGFSYCFLQGTVYFIFAVSALLNFIAFIVSKRHCFLYLDFAFIICIGAYLGYSRTLIKRKFNIRGNDTLVDDCIYHIFCPCCTLSQESRTLEMNNVQDGTWHGRGDICIGSYGEASKAVIELRPPLPISIKTHEPCSLQNCLNHDGNT